MAGTSPAMTRVKWLDLAGTRPALPNVSSFHDPRNPLALVPQPPRRQIVARGRAWLGLAARYEIRAGDGRDVGRTCKAYDGLCTAFWPARKQHDEADRQCEKASGALAETGRQEPRMKTVRRHASAGEAACEFAGEQDVGELGTAIGRHDAVFPGELQVVEIERATGMGGRGRIDDAGRCGRDQTLAQFMGQHEVRHVIGGERALKAVRRHLPRRVYVAGVIDKHVDARLGGGDLPADPLYIGEDRQVGDKGAMSYVGTSLPESRKGGVRTPAVARYQDEARPKSGKP